MMFQKHELTSSNLPEDKKGHFYWNQINDRKELHILFIRIPPRKHIVYKGKTRKTRNEWWDEDLKQLAQKDVVRNRNGQNYHCKAKVYLFGNKNWNNPSILQSYPEATFSIDIQYRQPFPSISEVKCNSTVEDRVHEFIHDGNLLAWRFSSLLLSIIFYLISFQ